MKKYDNRNIITVFTIFLVFITIVIPGTSVEILEEKDIIEFSTKSIINKRDNVSLDFELIKNITENLSNIIITEYDEKNGEIAKGRAFGTKGEHIAAEILYENFSEFGFDPDRDYIDGKAIGGFLDRRIEVIDYKLTIYRNASKTNCTVFTLPRRSMFGPHHKFWKLNHNFSYNDLEIRKSHPKRGECTGNYVILQNGISENNFIQLNGLLTDWIKKLLEFLEHY